MKIEACSLNYPIIQLFTFSIPNTVVRPVQGFVRSKRPVLIACINSVVGNKSVERSRKSSPVLNLPPELIPFHYGEISNVAAVHDGTCMRLTGK